MLLHLQIYLAVLPCSSRKRPANVVFATFPAQASDTVHAIATTTLQPSCSAGARLTEQLENVSKPQMKKTQATKKGRKNAPRSAGDMISTMPQPASALLTEEGWGLRSNIASRMACVIFRLDQELRDKVLRSLNLTYAHFRVLQVLFETDGQPIGDIARAIAVRQPALSRVIDQMEERSLVKRVPNDQDNRFMHVHLSALGRKRYAQASPAAHDILERALEPITPVERETLRELLARIDEHLLTYT